MSIKIFRRLCAASYAQTDGIYSVSFYRGKTPPKELEMYFGSVRFFKHLIYTVIIGWFTLATFFSVFFGIKYAIEAKKNRKLTEEAGNAAANTAEYDFSSIDDYYLRMAADGYTAEDIISFLEENEKDALSSYAEKYISGNPDKFDVDADTADSSAAAHGLDENTAIEYTTLYPDLYADPPAEQMTPERTIYLTFDDGPSENTLDILYILDKYDIKATFFMCGGNGERTQELMREVASRGHTIGIHSISHEYDQIYASVESFLDDMDATYSSIYEATGVKPQIMRFAGGSINNYNRLIYPQLIAEVTRRGFVYYDWNVSGEDATAHATWTSIYSNVLNGINENSSGRAIVLLHDSADKQLTVRTVEDIITALINEGYTFAPLDNTVKPITFSYVD